MQAYLDPKKHFKYILYYPDGPPCKFHGLPLKLRLVSAHCWLDPTFPKTQRSTASNLSDGIDTILFWLKKLIEKILSSNMETNFLPLARSANFTVEKIHAASAAANTCAVDILHACLAGSKIFHVYNHAAYIRLVLISNPGIWKCSMRLTCFIFFYRDEMVTHD